MRTLLYQCSAGIAGDMHLAAMVDLGVPEAVLQEGLQRLPCAGEFALEFKRSKKMGISGLQAQVRDLAAGEGAKTREGETDAGEGAAVAAEGPAGPASSPSGHRHYADILKLLDAADLAPGVVARAKTIFAEVAAAEAKIHDIPIERVHFHEVGALDSIVDVVGAAICLEHLRVDQVLCGAVELGGGFVDCAHGRLPVPAPATQEILKGVPCSYGGVEGEATTPTGAAILKAAVDRFEPPCDFRPQSIGYGLGTRDFHIPNVLRLALGDCASTTAGHGVAAHVKIEANIDDMSPEAYEPLIDHLLAAGADDVYFTPIVMKKSRPAINLAVLCPAEQADALVDAVLNRSTTIGLRVLSFEKHTLPRRTQTVHTQFGPVRVKVVVQPDGQRRWKSEYEDVRRIAAEAGLDYLQAKAALDLQIAASIGDDKTQQRG